VALGSAKEGEEHEKERAHDEDDGAEAEDRSCDLWSTNVVVGGREVFVLAMAMLLEVCWGRSYPSCDVSYLGEEIIVTDNATSTFACATTIRYCRKIRR